MPRTVLLSAEDYGGDVLDLSSLDLDEIANALADQTDYEHRWLINPQTGEVVFWTSDTGIDGQSSVDLDELDLICIDPVPSYIWDQDMADFADQVSDERAGRRLARALQGKGASAGSKPNSLVDHDAVTRFIEEHPEPAVP